METKKANSFFLFIMILLIICQLILGIVLKHFNVPTYLWTDFVEYGALLIPSIIYLVVTKRPIKETLKLKLLSVKNILILIVIFFLSVPLMAALGAVSQLFFHNYVSDAMQGMKGLSYFFMMVTIAVTPAICEETLMRGVVLSGYRNVDIRKAAIMNGFLFGLFHLGAQQFFYAFALGIVFVYVVEITGSIFASMICHFLINGFSTTIAWLSMKYIPNYLSKTAEISRNSSSSLITGVIFWCILALIFTPLLVIVIKELDIINGGRLSQRKKMQLIQEKDFNEEKVMSWPVYAIIVLYIGFMIVAQLLGHARV